MVGGYCGRILRVNLTTGEIRAATLPQELLRKYLGGSGLAARIVYDETDSSTDPLGPANVLVFMTGPLTGTKVPNAGRYQVATRSPLTGSFGEANAGGTWGERLKRAGYDGVVVSGRSPASVYLYIEDGEAQLLPAGHLWGLDTYEVDEQQKKRHGPKTCTACIGPAGERLVRFAAIMSDGCDARAAARCGVGAVMGSKNLKAISVNGQQPVTAAREADLKESLRGWRKTIRDRTEGALGLYGTSCGMETVEAMGDLPIKNWSAGSFDIRGITGQHMAETILVKRYFCGQCVIGCGRTIEITGGPYACREGAGPEYETLGMLGSNCLVGDLEAVAFANMLCNRHGLDTISTGGVISFVMEAYENGLITKDDLGGIEARWGDAGAVHALIGKIANREGFGDLLAEGTRIAAEKIGGLAPESAVHVRGLEFPAHDPRAAEGTALQYGTSARGACHLSSFTHDFEIGGRFPGLGLAAARPLDRFSTEGRASFIKMMQDFMGVCDSLPFCKFIVFGTGDDTLRLFAEWTSAVTGWNVDGEELLAAGERIFNLKRMYLTRDGQSRKDDVVPPKMRKRRASGGAADHIPHLDGMIDEYYELRGWNEYGIPTKDLLENLGLASTAKN
jgi:aldehyde:ferredoxin oxidoreductase